MRKKTAFWILMLILGLASCTGNQNTSKDTTESTTESQKSKHPEIKPFTGHYTAYTIKGNDTAVSTFKNRYTPKQQHTILALNRIDFNNFNNVDSLIIPDSIIDDFNSYSPFPSHVEALNKVNKIVFFSYPIQAFAAYENGYLVRWGPSSMGSKAHPTQTGLAFTNWKAEEHVSTADDEWLLRWNFNIHNKEGIGWHQYTMPGYPASHSCLRLLENDAKWLYDWADEWIVKSDHHVLAQGTPVIVYGAYDYDGQKPWFNLPDDPKANTIPEEELNKQIEPNLSKILQAQQSRMEVDSTRQDSI